MCNLLNRTFNRKYFLDNSFKSPTRKMIDDIEQFAVVTFVKLPLKYGDTVTLSIRSVILSLEM